MEHLFALSIATANFLHTFSPVLCCTTQTQNETAGAPFMFFGVKILSLTYTHNPYNIYESY